MQKTETNVSSWPLVVLQTIKNVFWFSPDLMFGEQNCWLKQIRDRPSCRQPTRPVANKENRVSLDVSMDAACFWTLTSLAAWRTDAGLDHKCGSQTRRLQWLLSLVSSFRAGSPPASGQGGRQRVGCDIISGSQRSGVMVCIAESAAPHIVWWSENWIKLSYLEKFMAMFYDFQFRHIGARPWVITPRKI